jgi:hypothetical protein
VIPYRPPVATRMRAPLADNSPHKPIDQPSQSPFPLNPITYYPLPGPRQPTSATLKPKRATPICRPQSHHIILHKIEHEGEFIVSKHKNTPDAQPAGFVFSNWPLRGNSKFCAGHDTAPTTPPQEDFGSSPVGDGPLDGCFQECEHDFRWRWRIIARVGSLMSVAPLLSKKKLKEMGISSIRFFDFFSLSQSGRVETLAF